MKKKILAADDLRTDSAASNKRSYLIRRFAVLLARQVKGDIKLVHVADTSAAAVLGASDAGIWVEEVVKSSEEALHKISVRSDIKIEKQHLIGPAAAKLIKLAQDSRRHECIVVGTQGTVGVGRLILGSVAEEVVRFSKIPVVTVGSKVEGIQGKISKILVATDLGGNSKKAEDYALALAKSCGAEVVLVHCLYGGLHQVLQTAMVSPNARKKFGQLLAQLKSEVAVKLTRKAKAFKKKGVKVSYVDDPNQLSASEVLLKEILKTGAELVVMGTHGRNLFGRAFFGSTVREVILNSPVPVVTVRSK